jgi:hypothetical protein
MSNLPFLDDQHELERYSTIVQQWIASVLEEEPHGTLQEYLSDGAVLCRLANKKRPGSIPRFHNKANVKALQLENIGKLNRQFLLTFRQVHKRDASFAWL